MISIGFNSEICVVAHDVRKTNIKFRFSQNFKPQLQLLAAAWEII